MDIEDIKYLYQERISIMTVDGKVPDDEAFRKVRKLVTPHLLKVMKGSKAVKLISQWKKEIINE